MVYKERVHYLKEFEPNLQVVVQGKDLTRKARRGCFLRRRANPQSQLESQSQPMADRAGAPYINDYGVLAAGPKWSVLRDFHNLYEKVENDELVITESTGADPPFPTSFREARG